MRFQGAAFPQVLPRGLGSDTTVGFSASFRSISPPAGGNVISPGQDDECLIGW